MDQEINSQDYLWVVTESGAEEDTVVGFADEAKGDFIPACTTKEDCLMLIPLLPPSQGGDRQVEAIHKQRLKEKSSAGGFQVYIVDKTGTVLGQLD